MCFPVHARRTLIALVALGFLGCASPAASVAVTAGVHRSAPARGARAPLNRPRALSPAATATDALGLDLLRTLGHENLVLSPDSIAAALAMVGTGAAGKTQAQILSTLHLRSPAQLAGIGALQRQILAEQGANGEPQAPTLDIANGLFLQDGFPVEAPFLEGLRESFGAAPQRVDFAHESPEAVHTIDSWIGTRTHGLIPELFSSLEPETRLVLANAIYLKAAWLDPFSKDDTVPAPFYATGQSSQVPFMSQTESIPYARGGDWTAVELPYSASTLSLLVVLPTGSSLPELERRLNPALLTRIAQGMRQTRVALSIPRIHLTLHTSLVDPLKVLGITDAFDLRANFSRIAHESLMISVVEHAADLELDEAGTVAAAATGVGVSIYLISTPRPPPVRFDANHPFLFFLRDDRTGALLFAGRLINAATAQD